MRTSSLVLRINFSLGSISNRDKKLATAFNFPGMYAVVKVIFNTKSQAYYQGGGITYVWRNWVTDFGSVLIISGLVVRQNLCSKTLKVKNLAKNFLRI